ncbi:protein of unknown function [Burkholderia sp. D7]|jgi:hypothetical protein|nr:protein of unknown function [Burkholderia sp. D7]
MLSTPKRTVLAGLLVGALVIGASVMRSGEGTLSKRDGASVSGELDNSSTEARGTNADSTSGHSDDVAHILQAVRDSLKRNDLASAKVLLGAVQTLHKDDSRALTLEKELQAREGKVDAGPSVMALDKPPNTSKPIRFASRPSAKSDRTRDSASPVREHTAGMSRHSTVTGRPQVKAPSDDGVSVDASSPAPEVGVADSTSLEAAPTVASTPARATPPGEETPLPAQPVNPKPLPVQSDQAPKTREQVRSELYRARANGALPRFGNPDPAGPGGLPGTAKTESGGE